MVIWQDITLSSHYFIMFTSASGSSNALPNIFHIMHVWLESGVTTLHPLHPHHTPSPRPTSVRLQDKTIDFQVNEEGYHSSRPGERGRRQVVLKPSCWFGKTGQGKVRQERQEQQRKAGPRLARTGQSNLHPVSLSGERHLRLWSSPGFAWLIPGVNTAVTARSQICPSQH